MYRYPSQTEKGVRNASYAMILFLVANLLAIVLVLALMPLIAAVFTMPPGGTPDPALVGTILGVVAAGCGLLIIELVGAIMGLLGLIAINRGKMEFGPEHSQRVDRGVIALVVGIILPIIGGVVVGTLGAAGGLGSIVPSMNPIAASASAAIGIAGTILVGLFLLWTVEKLVTPDKRRLGIIALVLGVVAGVAAAVTQLVVLYTVPLPTRPQDFSFLFVVPSAVGGGISTISVALWYMMYRSVSDRFKRGELQPIPPTPMYPPPYAQPYAPYYPPPYAPAPPPQPPAQPPPQNPPPNP